MSVSFKRCELMSGLVRCAGARNPSMHPYNAESSRLQTLSLIQSRNRLGWIERCHIIEVFKLGRKQCFDKGKSRTEFGLHN